MEVQSNIPAATISPVPNSPKSGNKFYFYLVILIILIAGVLGYFIYKNIPRKKQTVTPVTNIKRREPVKITPVTEKKLIQVNIDDAREGTATEATVTDEETKSAYEITPANENIKHVALTTLFSAYVNTTEESGQPNINLLRIGGLDENGDKYALFTYSTPSDRNPDAVFTSDGNKVAFQEKDGLNVYNFLTKEKNKIGDPIVVNYGGWNNLGNKLVYLKETDGKRQWNIYNTDDKTAQTLPTVFENDSSNFAWMPLGGGFAYNSQLTHKVYISQDDGVKELRDFDCDSNLMFSQDARYLTCTNTKWIRVYDTLTASTIKKDDPNTDWIYYYGVTWVNSSYKQSDPLLFVYKDGALHLSTKSHFFDSKTPESKPVILNPKIKNIMLAPGFGIYNIRFISLDQAISEGTVDGDNGSLILIEGFSRLSYDNPTLTIKFLDKNKGLTTHGFSATKMLIEVK